MTRIPRIGITLGDPAGVGPEVVVKALSGGTPLPRVAYVLFGSRRVVDEECRALGLKLILDKLPEDGSPLGPGIYLRDIDLPPELPAKGRPSAEMGRASFAYFENAEAEARVGKLEALVTAPISKRAWNLAGIEWRGHTEYLSRTDPGAIMSFWSEPLRVALFSHHLALREAIGRVKAGALEDFFGRLRGSLSRLTSRHFRFLVAGLNPHAGEEGIMGTEEAEVSAAVARARAAGLDVEGPFPPDTVFRKALNKPEIMVVALYHDQGLIPFKLVAFENGVNATLGLPFVRTSPDHGTAFDIAPSRSADPRSVIRAIELAVEFSSGR